MSRPLAPVAYGLVHCCDQDAQSDQQLDVQPRKADHIGGTQRQGERVPQGKRRDHDQEPPPVPERESQCQ